MKSVLQLDHKVKSFNKRSSMFQSEFNIMSPKYNLYQVRTGRQYQKGDCRYCDVLINDMWQTIQCESESQLRTEIESLIKTLDKANVK